MPTEGSEWRRLRRAERSTFAAPGDARSAQSSVGGTGSKPAPAVWGGGVGVDDMTGRRCDTRGVAKDGDERPVARGIAAGMLTIVIVADDVDEKVRISVRRGLGGQKRELTHARAELFPLRPLLFSQLPGWLHTGANDVNLLEHGGAIKLDKD